MPALTTNEQLLELIRKSSLVDERRLDQFLRDHGETLTDEPGGLAKALIQQGLITVWQAAQLLAGKWRGFFIAGGKYKLLELLGVGGMGKVYLCEHCRMQRLVAVKVLPTDRLNEPTSLERFEREARAAGALDHVNIVRAFDLDRDGPVHFFVMEYVDGASLHQIVKKSGPLAIDRACHYISQAADGLQHAHETAGLVHRDIKPGNILVDRSGTVKILDMGLARFFRDDDSGSLTRRHDKNAILGTADYLAPEQARNSSDVDIRADIYSLGVTFYFILAGRGLFDRGSVAEKLIWHQNVDPEPLRSLRPEVPADLEVLIAKMMAKKESQRFQQPADVVEALSPWTSQPIGSPPEIEMPRLCPALAALAPSSVSGPTSWIASRSSGTRSTNAPRGSKTRVSARPNAAARWWFPGAALVASVALAGGAWWLMNHAGPPNHPSKIVNRAAPAPTNCDWLDDRTLPGPANGVLLVATEARRRAAGPGRTDVFASFGEALALAGPNSSILVIDGPVTGQYRVDGRRVHGLVIEGRGTAPIVWTSGDGASPDSPLLTLADAGAARVIGFDFDGQNRVATAIRIEGDSAGLGLDRLNATGFRSATIGFADASAPFDRPATIENCRLQTSGSAAGVDITGKPTAAPSRIVVRNNRLEGPFRAGVRVATAVDLEFRLNRVALHFGETQDARGVAVLVEAPETSALRLRLASNTVARARALLHLHRVPAEGSAIVLRSNLLVDAPAFVSAASGFDRADAPHLFAGSAGNVSRPEDGNEGVATHLKIAVPFGDIDMNPASDGFLRYRKSGVKASLFTAGANGEPAGVPPLE